MPVEDCHAFPALTSSTGPFRSVTFGSREGVKLSKSGVKACWRDEKFDGVSVWYHGGVVVTDGSLRKDELLAADTAECGSADGLASSQKAGELSLSL